VASYRTFDWKFQLKNSKEFPHYISKSWHIGGGRNVYGNDNELSRKNVY
jgi:hypothetical protein